MSGYMPSDEDAMEESRVDAFVTYLHNKFFPLIVYFRTYF